MVRGRCHCGDMPGAGRGNRESARAGAGDLAEIEVEAAVLVHGSQTSMSGRAMIDKGAGRGARRAFDTGMDDEGGSSYTAPPLVSEEIHRPKRLPW